MRIAYLDEGDSDAARWDAYVRPRTANLTDLSAWRRVVRRTYGTRSHFLAAEDGDHLAGALGLFEVAHPAFGHYLSTAMFCGDGGFFFDGPEARDALVAEAKALADRCGVAYLVIRSREVELAGFRVDSHYRTAVLDLAGGAEAVWRRLPAKTRNQVRRGQKEGFSIETGHGQLEAFLEVFQRHMRELGSPAHGEPFYRALVEELAPHVDFRVVREGRELVGGALLLTINGTAMNLHTVALRAYNRRCPNYLLYWNMIETSAAAGCHALDMGRSESGSTSLGFKANWGTRELPLHYNYHLRELKKLPYLDPRNPKYRLAIACWRYLPLAVTRRLGPLLISGLA